MNIERENLIRENGQPLFTIALLGYQSEPFLPKALVSIERQSFKDFDVMCIVEESSDQSLEMCRKWAVKGEDRCVVSLPKSGSGAVPRNYAIEHAKGKYLVFVDGDDRIADNMLERLQAKIEEIGEVDVLAFAVTVTDEDGGKDKQKWRQSNFLPGDTHEVFTGQEAILRVGRRGGGFFGYSWLNTYRTDFVRDHNLRQKPGTLLEDSEWLTRVWYLAERFAYLDEPLYTYCRRKNSVMSEASSRIVLNVADHIRSIMSFAEEHSVPDSITAVWSNQWVSQLYWFLFHPVSSRKIADEYRIRALTILFNGDDSVLFRRFARRASRVKRLALPLIILASKGWLWPAKLFFRRIYYPLIKWQTSLRGC